MKLLLLNNRGVALVTSLMLTLITLGMVLILFYILTHSIKISAANKRYRNATEAAYGGAEFVNYDVIDTAWKNFSSAGGMSTKLASTYGNVNMSILASNDCLKQKLSSPASNWTSCSSLQKSTEILSIKSAADLTFLLKGTTVGQHFKVYAKIVDTSSGNTDVASSSILNANDSGGLLSASGSAYSKSGAGGGGVPIQHIPYGYRIEVQGEKETNPIEKSNVSVLYAY